MRMAAGMLAVVTALMTGGSMAGLAFVFGYPKIIRQDAITILETLDRKRNVVPYLYYAFGFGGVVLVFMSACLGNYEKLCGETVFSGFGQISGAIYGTLLFTGILRYTRLFPQIGKWMREDKISRQEAEFLFQSFNIYAGETVAEHAAFVFLTAAIGFHSVSLLLSGCVPVWISGMGMITAAGLFAGNFEFLGIRKLFAVNRFFSSLGVIWFLLLGIIMQIR